MRVVSGVDALEAADGPLFVVVGVFDGLHVGHAYLLAHLVEQAAARGARPAVITFDAHPDAVLLGQAPPLLLDPAERIGRLSEAGVAVTVIQHFDEALRQTPFDAFVDRIRSRASLAGFLMTPDAAFGHERRGTPRTLAAMGARHGFDVVVVPPFSVDGASVRSTDIRSAIGRGDLATAEAMLGRPYGVVGRVSDAGRLSMDMPVAMPPDGRYRCSVNGTAADLMVAGEAFRLASPTVTSWPGRAVRVVFDRR